MSLTVFVHGENRPGPDGDDAPSMTFDMPRIVVGRGDGCDVRLPDRSVSARHLTLRQRGTEWIVVDEGSTNGTRLGRVLLNAQAPRVLGPDEVVRVGKVWLRVVQGHEPATRAAAAAARSIALGIAAQHLARDGEEHRPTARVVAGVEPEERLVVDGGTVVVGRSRDADWKLEDADASRRHAEIEQRGDVLVVRDLGSKSGTFVGEEPVGSTWTAWRPGVELRIGSTVLVAELPAIEALAELERMPDKKLPASELEVGAPAPSIVAPDEPIDVDDAAPSPEPPDADAGHEIGPAARDARDPAARGSWSFTDLAVVVLAFGVMSLSAVGYLVLLR